MDDNGNQHSVIPAQSVPPRGRGARIQYFAWIPARALRVRNDETVVTHLYDPQ